MKFKQRDKGATNLLTDNKKTHTHIYIYMNVIIVTLLLTRLFKDTLLFCRIDMKIYVSPQT